MVPLWYTQPIATTLGSLGVFFWVIKGLSSQGRPPLSLWIIIPQTHQFFSQVSLEIGTSWSGSWSHGCQISRRGNSAGWTSKKIRVIVWDLPSIFLWKKNTKLDFLARKGLYPTRSFFSRKKNPKAIPLLVRLLKPFQSKKTSSAFCVSQFRCWLSSWRCDSLLRLSCSTTGGMCVSSLRCFGAELFWGQWCWQSLGPPLVFFGLGVAFLALRIDLELLF